jgi:hypothetical protein
LFRYFRPVSKQPKQKELMVWGIKKVNILTNLLLFRLVFCLFRLFRNTKLPVSILKRNNCNKRFVSDSAVTSFGCFQYETSLGGNPIREACSDKIAFSSAKGSVLSMRQLSHQTRKRFLFSRDCYIIRLKRDFVMSGDFCLFRLEKVYLWWRMPLWRRLENGLPSQRMLSHQTRKWSLISGIAVS